MKKLANMPSVKAGVVAVSRDCFPVELARSRLHRLVEECRKLKLKIIECGTIVSAEQDVAKAAEELKAKGVNALVIYLGNFGPEGPATILAQKMGIPFMFAGAAEESATSLVEGRGDALCGMLSVCFNAALRNVTPYLSDKPVALAPEVAKDIAYFHNVARVLSGLRQLKVFAFGPRPHDFYTCTAPIKPLYDLGVEIMENSELDLLQIYESMANQTSRINAIARDMASELGEGNAHPEKVHRLARFELALMNFAERNLGSRQFAVFANKCWPAFERAFGFVPCYVNSRLASRGIPIACEVDIYGAVSEYMAQLASLQPVTLLDINNTVPPDMPIENLQGLERDDLFMGFHCGNTPSVCLRPGFAMKYQLIMHRLMEGRGKPPDITCGTLEGILAPGPVTLFRLQATPSGEALMSYIAEGHVLDAQPPSFGAIGVIGVRGFSRFYRYVLLERRFAHHTAAAFRHVGRILFDVAKILGLGEIFTVRPRLLPYPNENPFAAGEPL